MNIPATTLLTLLFASATLAQIPQTTTGGAQQQPSMSAQTLPDARVKQHEWDKTPLDQRIQLSEPCSLVAKWLTQGLSAGAHWQMLRYEADLGILTFKVFGLGNLSKAETRQYIADASNKTKNVHVEQLVFTLRSLVTSTVSFDNAALSKADSCTIAAAFKFVSKDGTPWGSSGKMETELLQRMKDRYADHGLDY